MTQVGRSIQPCVVAVDAENNQCAAQDLDVLGVHFMNQYVRMLGSCFSRHCGRDENVHANRPANSLFTCFTTAGGKQLAFLMMVYVFPLIVAINWFPRFASR